MSTYIIVITIIGIAALGMAWMPAISRRTKISYSIIYVVLGAVLYLVFGRTLPLPNPIYKNDFTIRITELVVIISLMGSGLKIDEPFSLKRWTIPFRLVSITMLLSIFLVAFGAIHLLGFDPASALLLGAVLAPTDPVLASDVQVGPPLDGVKDHVRFSLTAEAGMNDGTAFPFVWLAIGLMMQGPNTLSLEHWAIIELFYKLVAGALVGFFLGRVLAFVLFRLPEKFRFIVTRDGFVAISATLLVYGFAEMVSGYGFVAVFVSAVTMRNYEIHHRYHIKMHAFTDQIERILVAIVLILFGGSLVTGILEHLTWWMVLFSLLFVLLVRPLTSFIALVKTKLHPRQKMAIGFFGIKGMGSFFYLAFALNETVFPLSEELWSVTAFVVLLSIILHGLTATSVMRRIEKEFSEIPAPEKLTQYQGI